MATPSASQRSEQGVAIGAVAALHVGALFALLMTLQVPPESYVMPELTLIDVAPPAPAVIRPARLASAVAAEAARPAPDMMARRSVPPPKVAAGCATTLKMAATMQGDPAAVEAARSVPAEARSVANAVGMWSGGWSPGSELGEPLSSLRAAVERSLSAIEDRCLDEIMDGPRLVPVPDGEGTMFLVFGSGSWRWRDVSVALGTTALAAD